MSGSNTHADSEDIQPLSRRAANPQRETPAWLSGIYAGICLYFFVSAINVMGHGLKELGKTSDFIERLMDAGHNPVVGLLGGVVVTAIVQSSSFTTSLIITLVAAGQMDLDAAIFAIMGANIGTSITNNLVCIGTFRIQEQFQRAYKAALMHGNVNFLTVGVLFPVEWITSAFVYKENGGVLMHTASWFAKILNLEAVDKPNSFVKVMTKPIVNCTDWLVEMVGGWLSFSPQTAAIVVAAIGLFLLFITLVFLVTNLKGALLRRVEGLFDSILFRNNVTSGLVGFISTVMVQSSSVTTSLIVPLAGAGAVKSKRVFPFMLGCNIGTTITGVIAATANPMAAAVSVAIAHVLFNLIGVLIWYPLRAIPIGLADWYAEKAARKKTYYFMLLIVIYGVIPIIGWFLSVIVFKANG